MYRTATPASVSWRTRSNSRTMAWRSSAAVGSSSSTHLAPRASARTISTTCSCSTDSSLQGVSGAMSKPHSCMMARVLPRMVRQLTTPGTAPEKPGPGGLAPRKTFSATDRCGTIIECWNTVAIHSRQRWMSPTRGAGAPPNHTVPASGSLSPDRMDTRVDLPAPLRPTRPRHCPAPMDRSTPRSARVVPNRFSTPVTSTSAGAVAVMAIPYWVGWPASVADAGHRAGWDLTRYVSGQEEAQTPPCAAPYTLPHSVVSLTGVVVTVPGRPSTGLDRVSVACDLVTNGATIGSARLVSPW